MVKDKEIDKVLAILPKEAFYYFTQAQIPRALPYAFLHSRGIAAGLKGDAYGDVNEALKTAMSSAEKEDLILICGSVFVVGEVIPPSS
jgi:dihydrofolate synthase/folylpolyglutamate synthase